MSGDWCELEISSLGRMSLKILLNAAKCQGYRLCSSKLLREIQQGRGEGG